MVDVDLCASGKPEFWDLLDDLCAALRLCTGVTHLSLGLGMHPVTAAKILASISGMRLRHLGAFLQELAPIPGPLVEALDARSSVFRDLTLLEVGDPDWDQTALRLEPAADPRIVSFICALPRLTHLGLNSTFSSATLRTLLDGCRKLQLLLFTLSSTMQEAHSSIEWATILPIRDPRIVVSVWRDWPECVDWDGPTYWKAARIFVEQKKLGHI